MNYIECESPDNFSLKTKDQPELKNDHALLRVRRIGICGTDLHAFKGNQPFFSYPRILGHEVATEVIEIGTNPKGIKPGDRVVLLPYITCQQCVACKAGKTNCCQFMQVFGVHTDGGMQEVINFPAQYLIPANDLSFEEIAIVEPLSIGAHALRRAQVSKDETIVVMGCGPIGMGIIQLARYLGCRVIAVDLNDVRLNFAKNHFGAGLIVNALHDPIEKIREFTNGDLARIVFDASGSKRAMEGGIHYMCHGGKLILVGLFKGELAFHHPSIHAKEASILCSRNATIEDFEFVMKVIREKKFNTGAYITKKVRYDAILTDFESWASSDSNDIKILTEWN